MFTQALSLIEGEERNVPRLSADIVRLTIDPVGS